MRTTLVIDDDLLRAAKAIAEARDVSVGKIISELARKGLKGEGRVRTSERGFPVFQVRPGARPITLDDVTRAEEQDEG